MLDGVFGALAHPTRRQLLETLARGDRLVGELAAPHAMSGPAISRHLRVLEAAGLIRRMREGRAQRIRLRTAPLSRAAHWLGPYAASWPARLEDLEALLSRRRRR